MPRRYAYTRIEAGDYFTASNDTIMLFRIQRYEDGRAHGLLDVPYERRMFWRVCECRSEHALGVSLAEIDSMPWREVGSMYRTRKEAEATIDFDSTADA
jgi:hypothetical protein